jgi:integrase
MTTTLKKIDGVYHAAVPAKGKKKWISTGSANKAEAEKIVAESKVEELGIANKAARLASKAIGQILTGKSLTCLKALDDYRRLKSNNKAAKTVSNHVLVTLNWMKEARVETLPPSSVTPDHISRWINNPDLEWKRSTRQVALSSVRSFFEFCSNKGWISSDPSQLVELDYSVMSHEQKEEEEKKPFTEDEVERILSELRKDWHAAATGKHQLFKESGQVLFWLIAVTIGKETGLRLSDIATLEWRSFGEPGHLIVWTKKRNKRIEYPISEKLQNLISEIPVIDAEYLFPEPRAIIRDVKKRSGLSVQFRRLLNRLEIDDGKSFHSLRHYKATQAFAKLDKETLAQKLAESLTLDQIAALLGHSNKKTTKGYLH